LFKARRTALFFSQKLFFLLQRHTWPFSLESIGNARQAHLRILLCLPEQEVVLPQHTEVFLLCTTTTKF
jgi:hypothetical protein